METSQFSGSIDQDRIRLTTARNIILEPISVRKLYGDVLGYVFGTCKGVRPAITCYHNRVVLSFATASAITDTIDYQHKEYQRTTINSLPAVRIRKVETSEAGKRGLSALLIGTLGSPSSSLPQAILLRPLDISIGSFLCQTLLQSEDLSKEETGTQVRRAC